jgi:RNA 2',3'-cyclic 3'-phosphodiesterase
MAGTTRTFIAVPVPDALGLKLERLQSLLAPDVPGARWATTRPFHLTLAFLGDVAHADLNDVCRATAGAASAVGPFSLRLEGLGAFPDPARPRVAWVGAVGPGLGPLGILQQAVAGAIRDAGHPPEDDRFHPHVTLGRLKVVRGRPSDLTPLVKHYRTWSPGSFDVAEAVVYSSTLTPDGPAYAPLARAPLRGRDAGAGA